MRQTKVHVAYHEAGHFVAHHHLFSDDIAIRISIIPDTTEGSLGHHLPLEGPPERVRSATKRERVELKKLGASDQTHIAYFDKRDVLAGVVEFYAGAAAELRLDPSRADAVRAGARSDDEAAAGWLGAGVPGRHPGLGEPQLEGSCRQRAARLVERYWNEIEAIAQELLRLREIDGEVAVAIIDVANRKRVDVAAGILARRLGRRKTAALLRRHGYNVTT